jgi:hypothetical protein
MLVYILRHVGSEGRRRDLNVLPSLLTLPVTLPADPDHLTGAKDGYSNQNPDLTK